MRLGTPITIKRDVFCHLPYSDCVAPRTGGERVDTRTQNGTTSTADRAFWVCNVTEFQNCDINY